MKPWPEMRFDSSLYQLKENGKKGISRKNISPFYFVYLKTNENVVHKQIALTSLKK